MKKKILLFVALLSLLACIFAISISAETPSNYIEFGARFSGSDEYITVYTVNAESVSNPRIDFANQKFYSDVDFTQEVDMSTATGIDFSVCKTYVSGVQGKAPTRMVKPSSPFVNCTEVRWFTQEGAMDYTTPSNMFNGWTSLKSFDFGNLKKIGDNSFEGCGFEELVLPSTITHLYSRSFALNLSLKTLKFEGPTELAGNANAFFRCSALESVDLGNVPYIGKGTFKECTALASVVIPSSVTDIKDEAFYGCTALNSVTYEGTPQVKTIGSGAFQKVPASNLTLPSSLEKITGQKAFAESGIQTVVIPAGCTDLSTYTFNKSNVTSVSFADGFTGPFTFNTGVFQTCSQLTSVELAEGVTVIGQDCFNGASIVTFVLPDSVTEIKGSAFANCKKLTTFTINPTSKLTTLGSQVFKDGISLTSFYFPNSLTSIGSGLFIYNNGSLKELINFENCGVTSIPSGVFSQCSGLKEVKFPYGVTEINGSDLLKWANLDSITLPQTLTTITNSITCNSIGKIIFAAPDGTPLPANAPNTTVEYVNYCETYFASAHIEGGAPTYTYVDEEGNVTNVAYTSALKIACPCGRSCGVENVIETIPALFVNQGYSTKEYADGGFSISFAVNKTAIQRYNQVMGEDITYGIFAVAQQNAQQAVGDEKVDKDIINADGTTVKGVASVEFSKHNYDVFAIRITGFETDEHKDAKLALGAYVIDGDKVTYLQVGTPAEGAKYCYTSYNEQVTA
ncbi:MAG: leucine-rich repeat domain-containing protein [Clostridia bacterium]|nr:leucine-rich repeat domain-containing protein [Clostridia bacterium]